MFVVVRIHSFFCLIFMRYALIAFLWNRNRPYDTAHIEHLSRWQKHHCTCWYCRRAGRVFHERRCGMVVGVHTTGERSTMSTYITAIIQLHRRMAYLNSSDGYWHYYLMRARHINVTIFLIAVTTIYLLLLRYNVAKYCLY